MRTWPGTVRFANPYPRTQDLFMTIRPPTAEIDLPQLARKSRRALEQEARGLKSALTAYAASAPIAGCAFQVDTASARHAPSRVRKAQQNLLAVGQQQARLMLVNAYGHLVSMGRLLGSDRAMSLFAHVTLSRSVCEAAVRHACSSTPRSVTRSGLRAARRCYLAMRRIGSKAPQNLRGRHAAGDASDREHPPSPRRYRPYETSRPASRRTT